MEFEPSDDVQPEASAEDQPAASPDVEFEEPASATPTPEVEADASDTAYAEDVAYEPPAGLTTSAGFEAEREPEPAAESRAIQIDLTPVIMLVIGLGIGFLAGFVGRPMLVTEPQLPVAAATTETVEQPSPLPAESEVASQASAVTPETVAQSAPATEEAPATPDPAASATAAAEREAALQDIMQTLIAQTRHFKGDPDAPVTILEFSDFQ